MRSNFDVVFTLITISFVMLGFCISASAQEWIDYSSKTLSWQNSINIDKDGNTWVGSLYGAVKITKDTSITYGKSSGLPQDNTTGNIDVYDIKEDDSGNYWFGSEYGLTKYNGKDWKTFDDIRLGRTGRIVKSIAIDDAKNIWIGTGNGLAKYDRDTIVAINNINGNVQDIEIDENGDVWVGTYDLNGDYEGVIKYDGSTVINFKADNSDLPKGGVWDIEIDESGEIWAGTSNGIGIYDNNNWRIIDKSNSKLPGNNIQDLEIDKNDTKWIAPYPKGLVKYNGSKWKFFDTANSKLKLNHVNNIAIDNSGNIWVTIYKYIDATSSAKGGLYKYERNSSSSIALKGKRDFVEIYPNPAQNQLKLQTQKPFQNYTLHTLTGRNIKTGQLKGKVDQTINVSSLSTGVYLLKVQSEEAVRTKKVVIE